MGQAGQRESVPRRGRGSWRAGPGRQRRGEVRASGCRRWRVGPGAQGGVLVWELASRWSRPARGGASVLGRGKRRCWLGRLRLVGEEGEAGPRGGRWVWAGKLGLGVVLGFFSFSTSISILFLTQAQLFEFKRNFEFKPL